MTRRNLVVFIEHRQNRDLLVAAFRRRGDTSVIVGDWPEEASPDLVIVDGRALDGLWSRLDAARAASEPVLLPVLLVVSRKDVSMMTRRVWRVVDELLVTPVEKNELQARVEILLRARRLSIELSRRNEEMETLLAGLSHDLRNLFWAMHLNAAALLGKGPEVLGKEARKPAGRLAAIAEKAERLTEDLLTYGRVSLVAPSLTTVETEAAATEAREYAAVAGGRHDAAIVVVGPMPRVLGDHGLVVQALRNLVLNAVRYVDPGTCPRVEVQAEERGDRVRIAVSDNGVGVKASDVERLFRPFVRSEQGDDGPGVGLGLAIVRKAVESMGGRAGAEARAEGGSRFWIDLPAPVAGRPHSQNPVWTETTT